MDKTGNILVGWRRLIGEEKGSWGLARLGGWLPARSGPRDKNPLHLSAVGNSRKIPR